MREKKLEPKNFSKNWEKKKVTAIAVFSINTENCVLQNKLTYNSPNVSVTKGRTKENCSETHRIVPMDKSD